MSSSTHPLNKIFAAQINAIVGNPDRLRRFLAFELTFEEIFENLGFIIDLCVAHNEKKKEVEKKQAANERVRFVSTRSTESEEEEVVPVQKPSKKNVARGKKDRFQKAKVVFRNDKKPLFHRC